MPPSINQASQQNGTPSILNTAGNVLSVNLNRRYWRIQNVGTNPLFILYGTGASSTVFNAVIKGGTGNSDGLGGSDSSSEIVYTGIISVAGTTPLYVVTEF